MTDTLHLEIITAGGAVVDTPAAQVTLPLADGEVGILPGHAPLLGALMCGVVRYTVLARTAERAPDIDLARAEAALHRAESDLEARGMEMNISTPEAARARAKARIRAVELWRKNG